MEQESKAYFKSLIQSHFKKIIDDIEKLKTLSIPISPDNAIGRISRMEAINDKSINDAALEKLKIRKRQLEEALKRVDFDDDYGVCLVCEENITKKRLEILPESTVCVNCLNQIQQD